MTRPSPASLLPRLALVAGAALLAACGGLPFEGAGSGSAERARDAVDAWARRHPDGWVVTLATDAPLASPSWSPPCSANPPSGFVTVRYETAGAEIDLAFRCTGPSGTGAAVLQERFAFAVLQRLPHGIAVPGWRFSVLTPTSSVSEGVTFADAGGGRVLVAIETPLFAVYGQGTGAACVPPADAPMPAGCWVQREHRVPLRLTLRAPIVPPGPR